MKDDRLTMAHYGYDGNGLTAGDRIELHPGCDLWMAGARFGQVTSIRPDGRCRVKLDRIPKPVWVAAERLRVVD